MFNCSQQQFTDLCFCVPGLADAAPADRINVLLRHVADSGIRTMSNARPYGGVRSSPAYRPSPYRHRPAPASAIVM